MQTDILNEAWQGLLYITAALLAILGLGGCILPYAGHFLILAGGVFYALAKGEPYPDWRMWALLALLAIIGTFIDNLTTALGAKKFGGGKAAFWFSLLGLILGTIFLFPIGIIAGPFAGAFLAEWLIARRSLRAAAKAGAGAMLGMLSGIGCKFIIAFAMIALITASH